MVDVIVYKPSSSGSCLYMINPPGYALGLTIYHIKHERVYVSYYRYIRRHSFGNFFKYIFTVDLFIFEMSLQPTFSMSEGSRDYLVKLLKLEIDIS